MQERGCRASPDDRHSRIAPLYPLPVSMKRAPRRHEFHPGEMKLGCSRAALSPLALPSYFHLPSTRVRKHSTAGPGLARDQKSAMWLRGNRCFYADRYPELSLADEHPIITRPASGEISTQPPDPAIVSCPIRELGPKKRKTMIIWTCVRHLLAAVMTCAVNDGWRSQCVCTHPNIRITISDCPTCGTPRCATCETKKLSVHVK